jgi:DNA-binding response OmpR family regulator
VTQHEGFLDVSSTPGAGTRISVYLPLLDGSVPDEVSVDALEAPGGSETILLAEDDPSVRVVVEQILEEAGYRVIAGENGDEAVAILDRGEPAVDLAILDVVMPGSGGLDVARHIRDRGLPIDVLLTSGYSLELARTVAGEHLPLLTKPFRRDELLARVRELLDG